MVNKHIRIFYGKYLDDISNEIDPDDILIDDLGEIEYEIEPGEPNIPTGGSFEIPLANLDPFGNQKYPYSFWQNAARTEEEGARTKMQIFFRIEIIGNPGFWGVFKDVSYEERDAKCRVSLDDLSFILESETRGMLKAYELRDVFLVRASGPNTSEDGIVLNEYPPLKDAEGVDMKQESLTFSLISPTVGRTSGVDRVGASRSGRRDSTQEFVNHMNIPTKFIESRGELREVPDYLSFDVTRNTFVKIGENTIFTKVRFFGLEGPGSNGIWMSIYHNGEAVDESSGTIPIGRFYKNEDLEDLQEEDRYDITIYDYDLGNSPDIILKDSDLPAYEKYLFGTSYSDEGSFLKLTTERYTFFDVVDITFRAVNASVANRFALGSFGGEVTVTRGSYSEASGARGEFSIVITGAPYDNEQIVVRSLQFGTTRPVLALSGDSPQAIASKLQGALELSIDWSRVFTFEVNPVSGNSWEVRGKTRQQTDDHNGQFVSLMAQIYERQFRRYNEYEDNETVGGPEPEQVIDRNGSGYEYTNPKTSHYYDPRSVTGGSEGGYNGDDVIRVTIGGNPVAQTPFIPAGQTPAQISATIASAINAEDNPYSATADAESFSVASERGTNETISIDVGVTGVLVNIQNIQNSYQLFDTEKLLDRNRLAFYADPIMFGWIDRDLIEVLVGCVWQVSAYFYAVPGGKIAVHSRDYHESLPNDVSGGNFKKIKASDIHPNGETDYGGGFKSYQIDRPIDLLGINNLKTNDKTSVYADADGLLDNPSNDNKKIKSSNYRTSNLGHPQIIAEAPDGINIVRISPEQGRFVPGFDMDDFLPTAIQQAIRFARSFDYPTITRPIKLKYKLYQDLRVGDYVYTEQDRRLWIIKSTSINPRSLEMNISLEFKKFLVGFYQANSEGIGIGEEFSFAQTYSQQNEESVGIDESFKMKINMYFEEPITIDESQVNTAIKLIYSESLTTGEDYSNLEEQP